MRLRNVIGAACIVTIPCGASWGQPIAVTAGHPLVAIVASGREQAVAPAVAAFLDGMRERGDVEGATFFAAAKYGEEDAARLSGIVGEFMTMKPQVFMAFDPVAVFAAKAATSSIPIVGAILPSNLDRFGLAASFARPGSNVTGILNDAEGLRGKQVEIAEEIVPGATVLGVLAGPEDDPTQGLQLRHIEAAAAKTGAKVVSAYVRSDADLGPAFAQLLAAKARAVMVLGSFVLYSERKAIAQTALAARIPTIFAQAAHVEAGGLISYGIDTVASARRTAYFVDRILKGDKPGDLPVEFPTAIDLTINVKTAKAIGVTIPTALLATADKLIE